MTEKEIRTKYKKIHGEMETEFYPLKHAGLIDDELKAIFDTSHGQNWNDMEAELIAEGYLTILEPPRDLEAEIDKLKARLDDITTFKGVA